MNDFTLLAPEFLVTGLAFLILTVDLFLKPDRQFILAGLAIVGLAAIAAFAIPFLWDKDDSLYQGLILVDGYALFFKAFFLILANNYSLHGKII